MPWLRGIRSIRIALGVVAVNPIAGILRYRAKETRQLVRRGQWFLAHGTSDVQCDRQAEEYDVIYQEDCQESG